MVKVGDIVSYYDSYGREHKALVTNVFGENKPAINVVYVSDDENRTDTFGRQIERQTSVVHRDNQYAHGMYWDVLEVLIQ